MRAVPLKQQPANMEDKKLESVAVYDAGDRTVHTAVFRKDSGVTESSLLESVDSFDDDVFETAKVPRLAVRFLGIVRAWFNPEQDRVEHSLILELELQHEARRITPVSGWTYYLHASQKRNLFIAHHTKVKSRLTGHKIANCSLIVCACVSALGRSLTVFHVRKDAV
ncbi:hypothetical protein CAPTEDRAFT_209225 [Capitella teleta]|uniref:Uncharacterized protein n=1 Tax=Capitella teleta TaxID=283909 RepID=R7VIM7_CAPTE|nr:hypothetical protein CAPTEDRAFT_209225 [Capitella teleta]|eukprot:ELU18668.1 hypothetical protein CAPTEDRAFT_209225 [Capitella teleta]